MLYMLAAMPHAGHDPSMWLAGHLGPGLALPVVGWALVAYFGGSAVVLVARTNWRPAPRPGTPTILRTPRVTATCQATMALGNGYLLVAMLG
jgi:hypothetical protein